MAIGNKPASQWWSVKDGSSIKSGNTICYGPYSGSTVDAAKQAAIKAIRATLGDSETDSSSDTSIPVGWTVGLIVNNQIKEYWVNAPISSTISTSSLVEKNVSSGGTGGNISVVDGSGSPITDLKIVIS